MTVFHGWLPLRLIYYDGAELALRPAHFTLPALPRRVGTQASAIAQLHPLAAKWKI